VAWSYFSGGDTTVYEYGHVHTVHTPGSVSITLYLLVLAVWYGLNWINMVNEWERRPVMRFGRYISTAGPGLVFVEPLIHTVLKDVPVQDIVAVVPLEHVQTKDNVGVSLVGLLTYRIDPVNVRKAVVEVADINTAIMQRGISTLTDEVGKSELTHLLDDRDKFCGIIKETLTKRVESWGAKVQAFELKSFKITDSAIENAIAMKAKAQKEGEAELTRAEMQTRIAEALNKAAATYNEQGWRLKSIETLIELCRSAQNNTILLPSNLSGMLGDMFTKVK
jgi:regulator of protease activity HflC (stomatin/prohibitin superfamily)